MNKLALSAILASLAVAPVLSQAAQTDDVSTTSTSTYGANTTPVFGANTNPNWQDDFFVAGQLGQSQNRSGLYGHNQSVFQNVRFGWRWMGIIGPEIGYAYLGRPKDEGSVSFLGIDIPGTFNTNTRAVTVGLNAKYNVYKNWFVTAHGGYLRSQARNQLSLRGGNVADETNYNNGWYGGLGVGYDLTPNFSVGVNYDNYHVDISRSSDDGIFGDGGNIAAYSVSVEYRF